LAGWGFVSLGVRLAIDVGNSIGLVSGRVGRGSLCCECDVSFGSITFVRRLVGVLYRLGDQGTCELMNEAGLGDMGSYIYLGKRIA
jgi:hypothetical protein